MTNVHHNSLAEAPAVKKQITSLPTWSNSDKMIRQMFADLTENSSQFCVLPPSQLPKLCAVTLSRTMNAPLATKLQSKTRWGGQFQQVQCFDFTLLDGNHLNSNTCTSLASHDLIRHYLVKYKDCTKKKITGLIWTGNLWWLLDNIPFSLYSQLHATYKTS